MPGRDEVFAKMRDAGIGVGVHYPPNHLQPAFSPWHRPLPITEAVAVADRIISLPFHPAIIAEEAVAVVDALDRILSNQTADGDR